MQPAADAMADALSKVEINAPCVPVVANVLAEAIRDPDEIAKRLVDQVTSRVRWRESVLYMTENGITDIYEIGTGKVLAGLVRRTARQLKSASIDLPEDIAAHASAVCG